VSAQGVVEVGAGAGVVIELVFGDINIRLQLFQNTKKGYILYALLVLTCHSISLLS
jgi:hypothetical protein